MQFGAPFTKLIRTECEVEDSLSILSEYVLVGHVRISVTGPNPIGKNLFMVSSRRKEDAWVFSRVGESS